MINRIISFVLSLSVLLSSFITGFEPVKEKLRITVPENWELCVGDSRSLECVFSEKVKNRNLVWSVEPETVATVDKWGRRYFSGRNYYSNYCVFKKSQVKEKDNRPARNCAVIF